MKGYIYLICDPSTETYKIGRTSNPVEKRLKQLQTGCSGELFIMDTYETEYPVQLEKMLHRKFFTKKQLNEWFKLDSDDICGFSDICKQYDEIIASLKTNYFYNKKDGN